MPFLFLYPRFTFCDLSLVVVEHFFAMERNKYTNNYLLEEATFMSELFDIADNISDELPFIEKRKSCERCR